MTAMSGSPFSHSCTAARTWSRVIDVLMTLPTFVLPVPNRRGARNSGDWDSFQYASPTAARPPSAITLVTPKLRNSSPRNG